MREARIYQNGDDLQVSVSGDEVRDAPSIEAGGELSNDDERRLFTSITTCPTPKRAPASTTRRQAVLRINRIKPAPTHARASAFRAYSGDSCTRTVTRRRLDTKRT
jgi:hypothetical protein